MLTPYELAEVRLLIMELRVTSTTRVFLETEQLLDNYERLHGIDERHEERLRAHCDELLKNKMERVGATMQKRGLGWCTLCNSIKSSRTLQPFMTASQAEGSAQGDMELHHACAPCATAFQGVREELEYREEHGHPRLFHAEGAIANLPYDARKRLWGRKEYEQILTRLMWCGDKSADEDLEKNC